MITYKVKVTDDGAVIWCNDKDQIHRLDGPAYQDTSGYKAWWVNGKHHRLDGPALEYSWGTKEWWIEGEEYTEKQFNAKIEAMNRPCKVKKVTVDGVEYTLA